MPVSLSDENRVAVPPSVLDEVAGLTREMSEHVQTQLLEITEAGYTPEKLVYKQYGDLKVFRCGDEMRIFGVVLEGLSYLSAFDNVVIVLSVSEHDYQTAGVDRRQARTLQSTFGEIDSEEEFYEKLNGTLLDSSDVAELL